MSSTKKQIDDIVKMLDEFMSNDGGHMNITVDQTGRIQTDEKIIERASLDCVKQNLACQTPTLFKGLDNEEED